MRQNSEGKIRDIISMEEYLRQRQEIKERNNTGRTVGAEQSAAVLKIAALFYI